MLPVILNRERFRFFLVDASRDTLQPGFMDNTNPTDTPFIANDTASMNRTLALIYGNQSEQPVFNLTAGVILTIGTPNMYDYNVLSPALEVAFARARHDYNIHFEQRNYLYEVVSWSDTSPDPRLAKTQGCWMWNASGQSVLAVNDSVDLFIGPACTQDMEIVNLLLTYFKIPSVTGAANFVDTTSQFPYFTRCGFNTFDMWNFVRMMMDKYSWNHIAIIYDNDDRDVRIQYSSKNFASIRYLLENRIII